MKLLSTIVPAAAVLALLTGCSAAKSQPPAVIQGNAYGLWSPTHPHLTSGKSKPYSPVLYVPPSPDPVVGMEPELAEDPAVCPTLQSAPHLCQSL